MSILFEQTTINGMRLENRFVRSATWEGMCEDDGRPTERLAEWYRELARGRVGLIITGYTFVRPEGKQLPRKMGLYSDAFAGEMRRLVEAVHEEGGKIAIQLVHAGGQTDAATIGRQPLAPSAVASPQYPEVPAAMTKADINDVVAAFGDAARRAREYGFDAVQIHGAHGYLVNQFLSPLTNKRDDEYGGSIENRCRFLLEVYDRIRSEVGDDYPVMIKLNAADNLEGGLVLDDALYAAKALDRRGIDAIEVSGGTPASGEESPVRANILRPEQEAYHVAMAHTIKDAVSCPVMVVGGIRSFAVAEKTVVEEAADYISLARPLIREPDLVRRWLEGDRKPARCISCNSCFEPGLKEGGIYCVIEKKEREKGKE